MRSPVDGHCLASYDTSLVVSGGVDCQRRWQNVYDKKPQRYVKDNRTAHLTACSDKSVAYVTNNKRLYSTFCTVEANYWQTWSIARPLCDSRAICWNHWWWFYVELFGFDVSFLFLAHRKGSLSLHSKVVDLMKGLSRTHVAVSTLVVWYPTGLQ